MAIGLYHELTPQWAFVADVDWTKWSTFKEIRIQYADGRPDKVTPMNWHDTWFFSVGLIYKVDERQSIQFGAAYDQSAVDDKDRTAGIPETSRYLAGGRLLLQSWPQPEPQSGLCPSVRREGADQPDGHQVWAAVTYTLDRRIRRPRRHLQRQLRR